MAEVPLDLPEGVERAEPQQLVRAAPFCFFNVERPHQSKFNPQQVKVNSKGYCTASRYAYHVSAWLELERFYAGRWTRIKTGPRVTRTMSSRRGEFPNNQLVVAAPCVKGRYRGKIRAEAWYTGGPAQEFYLAVPYGPEYSVTCG